MGRTLAALFAIALAALPVSAAPNVKVQPADPPFFPTRVGTTWVYQIRGGERTEVITGSETADGVTTLTIGPWVGGPTIKTLVVSATEVRTVAVELGPVDPPLLVLRFPPKPGDSWEFRTQTPAGLSVGKKTVGELEEVEVPASKFKAFRLETVGTIGKQPKDTQVDWYAPGVGLVKSSYGSGGRTGGWQLKSFTLGKE